jgi:hypothetical protein
MTKKTIINTVIKTSHFKLIITLIHQVTTHGNNKQNVNVFFEECIPLNDIEQGQIKHVA